MILQTNFNRPNRLATVQGRPVSLIQTSDVGKCVLALVEHFNATVICNNLSPSIQLIEGLEVFSSDKVIGREFETVVIVLENKIPRELVQLVTRAMKKIIFVQSEGDSHQQDLKIDQCIYL